jgi:F-type H+-transporting ATPase subunit delta
MRGDKQTKLLARQLFKLSVVNGQISAEQVSGVLAYIEKIQPRHSLALLKLYHRAMATEFAKSRAVVEHAGPVSPAALKQIEGAMSQKYQRPVAVIAQSKPGLLAGLRVRVGSDVYESTIAGQLASLSSAV